MTREDIIRMAREANIKQAIETPHLLMVHELDRFAALVAASARDELLEAAKRNGPIAWMSPGKERLEFSRADTVYGSHTIPLYADPMVIMQTDIAKATGEQK